MDTVDISTHLRILRRHSIRLAGWLVVSLIGKWPTPRAKVAAIAASHSEGDPRGSVCEHECQRALTECLEAGWLRVIDKPTLLDLRLQVRAQPGMGPIYGFPRIGDVDFTAAGARLYRQVLRELHGSSFADDHISIIRRHGREQRFTRYHRTARKELCKLRHDSSVRARMIPIRGWYVYWWHRYPKGYRIDVQRAQNREEKEHRGKGGGDRANAPRSH